MPYAVALRHRSGRPPDARPRDRLGIRGGTAGRTTRRLLPSDELAERLSSELRRSFLFFKQRSRQDVSQVLLCGALPDLRSLTAPLIRRSTSKSRRSIRSTALMQAHCPSPPNRFREQMAELRLAWALSADPAPPVNLLPAAARARRGRRAGAGCCWPPVWPRPSPRARRCGAERTARRGRPNVRPNASSARLRARAARDANPDPRVRDAALESVRQSALAAFDTQGPRLARVLETLARLAPGDVTLRSVTASAEGASWRLSIAGTSAPAESVHAQATVTGFLDRLQASPYFGPPIGPPALRMIPERADTAPAGAGGEGAGRGQPPPVPGRVGVEFTVEFMVRK